MLPRGVSALVSYHELVLWTTALHRNTGICGQLYYPGWYSVYCLERNRPHCLSVFDLAINKALIYSDTASNNFQDNKREQWNQWEVTFHSSHRSSYGNSLRTRELPNVSSSSWETMRGDRKASHGYLAHSMVAVGSIWPRFRLQPEPVSWSFVVPWLRLGCDHPRICIIKWRLLDLIHTFPRMTIGNHPASSFGYTNPAVDI